MRTIRIKLYKFTELSKEAQDKVINQTIMDMIQYEHADHYENWPEYKKAIDKAEEMQTPWFSPCYVWDYCAKDIIASLSDISDTREYTKDGKFA